MGDKNLNNGLLWRGRWTGGGTWKNSGSQMFYVDRCGGIHTGI